jgi:hypothetical protein
MEDKISVPWLAVEVAEGTTVPGNTNVGRVPFFEPTRARELIAKFRPVRSQES